MVEKIKYGEAVTRSFQDRRQVVYPDAEHLSPQTPEELEIAGVIFIDLMETLLDPSFKGFESHIVSMAEEMMKRGVITEDQYLDVESVYKGR